MWQLPYQLTLKKILSKLVNFCAAILILRMEEDTQHFWHIVIISRKVKTWLKHKNSFVQCVEKVPWLIKCVKSGLWSFLTYWHFGQIILCCEAVLCIGRYLAASLASTHWKPIATESWHTQNTQINKVIGENEKCVFYREN